MRSVSNSPLAADGGTRRSRRVGFDGDFGLGGLGFDEHAARKRSVSIRIVALSLCLHNEADGQRRD